MALGKPVIASRVGGFSEIIEDGKDGILFEPKNVYDLAEKIIKSQLSNEERIKKADVVIENNSSLEDLFEKVERFCETI